MTNMPVPPAKVSGTTTNGSVTAKEYDVIIVGAGFSGISALHRLRKDGMNPHIFEAGSDFGGVWYWNRYPGARVDSETPFYQLNIPEVYNTWSFSQRFPDHCELKKYFAHIDETLGLRKDVSFDARVNGCTWDKETAQWTVKTVTGITATAQWLILATGILNKTHLPLWPGKEKYSGTIHHSSDWPEDTSVKGKRVAIIGAGATSVQLVQELAKEASHLSILLRRPPYCLPMGQRTWTEEEQRVWRSYYPALFAAARKSAVGLPCVRRDMRIQDVSPSERERYFEELWACGGVHFLLRNFNNVMIDKEANKTLYEFWKKKVRERLTDTKKQALMAPDEMPYFFSTRRTPLEHDYYEVLNRESVDIVDIKQHPIESFTERGLKLGGDEQDREYDHIVCATGFDSFTGSLTTMGLVSKDGIDIKDVWRDGVRTYLGLTIHGFSNAFMVYSPQAPTALSNAPTLIECQVDFICDTILALRQQGAKSIEATSEAEEQWKEGLEKMVEGTLYPYTSSWWNTSNVPGKKSEQQNYILGIKNYEKQVRETMEGWKGFDVVV